MKATRTRLVGCLSMLFILGLTALGLPMVQSPTSFHSTYGGDPGLDEMMHTGDDLNYWAVLSWAAAQGISFLTVDYDAGDPGSDMDQDAHLNFQTIAFSTGGVYYFKFANPNWQTAVLQEISDRVGSGKGDVVFVFDLSGSMGGAILTDVKTKTEFVIDGLAGRDVAFGIGTHVDYPIIYEPEYDCYNYSATYGSSATGDYAWKRDLNIVTNGTLTKGIIDALKTYWGGDTPQDYARAVYETQFFAWRTGAKRIVVMLGDAAAHSGYACIPTAAPVGGIVTPISAFELLGPYLSLALVSTAAAIVTAVYAEHLKRKHD